MKPFVAIAVLVAASLTAVSAAPSLQQVAAGSRLSSAGQRPSVTGGFSLSGSSRRAFNGQVGLSGASLGGQVAGGAFAPFGGFQSQVPSFGNYWLSSYPGYQNYYNPGQSYYQSFNVPNFYGQGYGNNGASWGYGSGYANSGPWGAAGQGYGYNGVFPTGHGFGSQSFGGFRGQSGLGQSALPGGRLSGASGSRARSQSQLRRQ